MVRPDLTLAPQELLQAVAQMFLRFPATGQLTDRKDRTIVYVEDLHRFPLWAILQAIGNAKGDFAPASNRLQDACSALVEPFQVERSRLNRILSAEVVKRKEDRTEAERAELVRKMLGRTVPGSQAPLPEAPSAPPPKPVDVADVALSDAARATLGS